MIEIDSSRLRNWTCHATNSSSEQNAVAEMAEQARHAATAAEIFSESLHQANRAAGDLALSLDVSIPRPGHTVSGVKDTVDVSTEGMESDYYQGWGGRTHEPAESEPERRDEPMASDRQEAIVPSPQPAAYDDLVRKAFNELVKPGRILFNPPHRMRLDQTARVEVRLTRTLKLDAKLLQQLSGPGEPQIEKIPTAPLMAVTLKGGGFRITAYSDEEQSVTVDEITIWEFDIHAVKPGQQILFICVSLRIPVPGQPLEHKSIPVREARIDVQVSTPALAADFVSANWQWFIATVIAIAAVLVAIYH